MYLLQRYVRKGGQRPNSMGSTARRNAIGGLNVRWVIAVQAGSSASRATTPFPT